MLRGWWRTLTVEVLYSYKHGTEQRDSANPSLMMPVGEAMSVQCFSHRLISRKVSDTGFLLQDLLRFELLSGSPSSRTVAC